MSIIVDAFAKKDEELAKSFWRRAGAEASSENEHYQRHLIAFIIRRKISIGGVREISSREAIIMANAAALTLLFRHLLDKELSHAMRRCRVLIKF